MEIPRHWRLQKTRYTLTGEECGSCETKIFPPRDHCPNCGKDAKREFQFSGKGEVHSYTTVYEAPAGFQDQAPYTLATVELDEGPLVTAQISDDYHFENGIKIFDTRIGNRVEMVTRKLKDDGDERGMIIYGYKFRPAVSSSK